jgi:hypothetical protein
MPHVFPNKFGKSCKMAKKRVFYSGASNLDPFCGSSEELKMAGQGPIKIKNSVDCSVGENNGRIQLGTNSRHKFSAYIYIISGHSYSQSNDYRRAWEQAVASQDAPYRLRFSA